MGLPGTPSFVFDDLEDAPLGAVQSSLDGRLLRCNQAFGDILGYRREQLEGEPWARFTHPDDVGVSTAVATALGKGDRAGRRLRKRYVHADGSTVHVELAIVPVRRDGNVAAFLTLVVDVGAQVALGAELRRSQERLQTALDLASDGIRDWDLSTGELWANQRWREVVGIGSDEPIDSALWQSLLHPDDAPRVGVMFQAIMAGKLPEWQTENHIQSPARGDVFVIDRGRVLESNPDGTPKRLMGSVTDRTELRRVEAELNHAQRMESLGRLAGGVAHDFNNLLSVITISASLLGRGDSGGADQTQLVDEILEAVNSGAALTRQLLTFSRRQLSAPKLLDVRDKVRQAVAVLQRTLGDDIDVATELGVEPAVVSFDPTLLSHIFLNLGVNAKDAMPDGGTFTLSVAVVNLETPPEGCKPGPYVRFVASDTGTGMTPEVCARAFEPFFTTKGHGEGTGLGLSSVYGAVRHASGFVDVESVEGEGTRIRVHLPVASDELPGAETAGVPARWLRGQGRVVLLEDSDAVRQVAERMLKGLGYTVRSFAEPSALFRAVEDGLTMDAMVSDVMLPGLLGTDVVRRLRELDPELPVVFITGYVEAEIDANERTELLVKPFRPEQLAEALARLMPRGRGPRR